MINALKTSSPVVLVSRILIAAVIVLASYNPTGTSIFHWVKNHDNPTDAWVVLGAIVAILANLGLLIAAWKALGIIGTTISLILMAALAYLSWQEGWIVSGDHASVQWLALALYSIFLGIGLSGAIIWRRITGQVVVIDEAGEIGD